MFQNIRFQNKENNRFIYIFTLLIFISLWANIIFGINFILDLITINQWNKYNCEVYQIEKYFQSNMLQSNYNQFNIFDNNYILIWNISYINYYEQIEIGFIQEEFTNEIFRNKKELKIPINYIGDCYKLNEIIDWNMHYESGLIISYFDVINEGIIFIALLFIFIFLIIFTYSLKVAILY
jgi:hypothetical protein